MDDELHRSSIPPLMGGTHAGSQRYRALRRSRQTQRLQRRRARPERAEIQAQQTCRTPGGAIGRAPARALDAQASDDRGRPHLLRARPGVARRRGRSRSRDRRSARRADGRRPARLSYRLHTDARRHPARLPPPISGRPPADHRLQPADRSHRGKDRRGLARARPARHRQPADRPQIRRGAPTPRRQPDASRAPRRDHDRQSFANADAVDERAAPQ